MDEWTNEWMYLGKYFFEGIYVWMNMWLTSRIPVGLVSDLLFTDPVIPVRSPSGIRVRSATRIPVRSVFGSLKT